MNKLEDHITIPRLTDEGETDKAYAARIAYITMGAGRSLEKLRGQTEGKVRVTNRLATLEAWSARYQWTEYARRWDEHMAVLIARDASEQYRRDLEAHRMRYKQVGEDLYKLGKVMMARIGRQLQEQGATPAQISDDALPGALRTLASVVTTAADLEAHALRLDVLLPMLTPDDVPNQ